MKIKFLKTFQLNCSGVRGMVWQQNDSYSTSALLLLRGRQEQHGMLLFQSERFQIPGGRLCKFLQCPLCLSMGRRLWCHGESGIPDLLYPHTKFPSEQMLYPCTRFTSKSCTGYNIRVVN